MLSEGRRRLRNQGIKKYVLSSIIQPSSYHLSQSNIICKALIITIMTKENNGNAARKLLIRRLTTVLISFLVVIGCMHLLGIGDSEENHPNQAMIEKVRRQRLLSNSQNMKNAMALRQNMRHKGEALISRSMFNNFVVKRQQLQQQRHRRRPGGPEIIKVTFDESADPAALALLLNAEVHLVETSSEAQTDYVFFGDFCTLNFAAHKADPTAVPMFRHLVAASPECDRVRYRVNLHEYVHHAKIHDAKKGSGTKSLKLTAAVFHEARCGSTLVSNALIAMNPAKHRVYSESYPPFSALTYCGETDGSCTVEEAGAILQDVVYAMGRTNDPAEERLFFKIQSAGTRSLKVFQHAFPDVPFLFVYRDSVQVMMSLMTLGQNCLRTRPSPPSSVLQICRRKGLQVRKLS